MPDWLDEGTIRLGAFVGCLVLFVALESLWPRRTVSQLRDKRWPANIGIVVVDTLLARLLLPGITVAAALWTAERGIGLFHWTGAPPLVAVVLSLVLFDLAIWGQHVIFHKAPWLWRLHRVHHTDLAFDATTAVCFHPVEILISLLIKAALVIALGAPAVAIVLFEIVLSSTALFNHANLRLPLALDAVLRLLIVTPDMHRVHHSVIRAETDSNFGFNLSVWDRLFGTYRAQPEKGHDGMEIGIAEYREIDDLGLWGLLKQPFLGTPKG